MGGVNPMLERAAKAIFERRFCERAFSASLWEEQREEMLADARAALGVLLEPAADVVEAGFSAVQAGAPVHTPAAAKAVARTVICGALAHILADGT